MGRPEDRGRRETAVTEESLFAAALEVAPAERGRSWIASVPTLSCACEWSGSCGYGGAGQFLERPAAAAGPVADALAATAAVTTDEGSLVRANHDGRLDRHRQSTAHRRTRHGSARTSSCSDRRGRHGRRLHGRAGEPVAPKSRLEDHQAGDGIRPGVCPVRGRAAAWP